MKQREDFFGFLLFLVTDADELFYSIPFRLNVSVAAAVEEEEGRSIQGRDRGSSYS